jgi:hypothetical protein
VIGCKSYLKGVEGEGIPFVKIEAGPSRSPGSCCATPHFSIFLQTYNPVLTFLGHDWVMRC